MIENYFSNKHPISNVKPAQPSLPTEVKNSREKHLDWGRAKYFPVGDPLADIRLLVVGHMKEPQ